MKKICLLILSTICQLGATEIPQLADQHSITLETFLKAKVLVKDQDSIFAPGISLPIDYIIADGAAVKKGDLLCRLDDREMQEKLKTLLLRRKKEDTETAARITAINNDIHRFNDSLDKNSDQIAIKEATLTKKLRLPDLDEVRISKGKLRVAELEFKAAESEFQRGRERLRREMISSAEFSKITREKNKKKLRLKAAELELKLSELPASQSSIKQTQYEIQILKKEREKILLELETKKKLTEQRIKVARRGQKKVNSEIDKIRREIKQTEVIAPRDGIVRHKPPHSRSELSAGKYLSPDRPFLLMPDLNTVYLEALMPAKYQPYISQGTSALVYINNGAALPLKAKVSEISQRSFDLGQTLKREWGQKHQKTGLVVYKIKFKLMHPDSTLRPGMHARVKILSSEKNFPAVPLNRIQISDQKITLTENDKTYLLEGLPWKGHFFISKSRIKQNNNLDTNGPVGVKTLNGEVTALSQQRYYLPHMKTRSVRLNLLKEEESLVQKGDLVASFDKTVLEQAISDEENNLEKDRLKREEKEQEWMLKKNEIDARLHKAENQFLIDQLKERDALNLIDSRQFIKAQLNVALAEIELQAQQAEVTRHEKSSISLVSELQLKKIKRDLQRKQLLLEKEQLNLEKVQRGQSLTEKSRKTRDRVESESNWNILKEQAKLEILKAEKDFTMMKFKEEKRRKDLKELLEDLEGLDIKAANNGMVIFPETYISGELKKPARGDSMYRGANVFNIADTSSFAVRADVPEALLPYITKGMKVPLRFPFAKGRVIYGEIVSTGILFEPRRRQSKYVGLYSSHEPLGESIFKIDIRISGPEKKLLKPGMPARIEIPLNGSEK